MCLAGRGPGNDYAREVQQHLYATDPSYRQRGRPTSTKPYDSNRNLVIGPNGCLTSRQTGQLAVGRNTTLTLRERNKPVLMCITGPQCQCGRKIEGPSPQGWVENLNYARALRQQNMVMSPVLFGIKNDCAGEGQQELRTGR
jgi:hypothetical protein